MDGSQKDQKKKRVTLQKTEVRQNGNIDIASITVGSTARAAKKNGTLKGGRENKRKSGEKEKEEEKTSKHPAHDSSPCVKDLDRTGSPRGGRMDQGATGDNTKRNEREKEKKKKAKKSDKDIDRDKCSFRTGEEEKTKKKSDRERSERPEGKRPKRTQTQAGGHGRRTVGRNNARDSNAPQMDKQSANTGSGSSTSQDRNVGETNPVDHPLRSDIGSDSRAKFLDIISKLFPLAIKVESSISSTALDVSTDSGAGSPTPSSLDETLVAVEALENNFEDLAKWFELFESTKARDVIGFDLAMELCGSYDLVIRRLGNGLRDTFGECSFIQSAQQVKHADQVLKYLGDILKGDVNRELKTVLEDMSRRLKDTPDLQFNVLLNAVQKLSHSTAHLLSALHIEETLKVQWGVVLEIVRALITMIKNLGNRCLRAKDECTQQHKELTSASQEIDRLQHECNIARVTMANLNIHQSQITHRMGIMSEMYKEETDRNNLENSDRIRELQQLYCKTETAHEELKRQMSRITMAHDGDRFTWGITLDDLRKQLATKDSTIERMKKEHLKVQGEQEQRITSLEESEESLKRSVSKLKFDMRDAEARHTQEINNARREMSVKNDSLCKRQCLVDELMCTNVRHEKTEKKLSDTVKTLSDDIETLNITQVELLKYKNTLCSLGQFLGVEMRKCDFGNVLDRIRAQKDASVERITKVLKRTCIQVIKNEDDDHDHREQHQMDTLSEMGQMFKEYESEICDIIQTLTSECISMDVSCGTHTRQDRDRKSAIKRKHLSMHTIESGASDHVVIKKQGYKPEVKPEVNQDVTNEESCQVIPQTDNQFASVQDVSGHSAVNTFDIELDENDTIVTIPIPSYITANLIVKGDVKIVKLGYQEPIHKLLSVLQAKDDEIKTCSEITQNTCHCLQMKQISERLKCTIFICWSPGGEHELYGDEHKDVCLYTIIVKHDRVRSYYLLSVRTCDSYVYNLAKLPYTAQFQPLKHGFVHESDGTCQGPVVPNPTYNVGTIETNQIVLHGPL